MTVPHVQPGWNGASQVASVTWPQGAYTSRERIISNFALNFFILIGTSGIILGATMPSMGFHERSTIIVLGACIDAAGALGRVFNYYLYEKYGNPAKPQNCLV